MGRGGNNNNGQPTIILNGYKNYQEWADATKINLIGENAWDLVTGTLPEPTEPATITTMPSMQQLPTTTATATLPLVNSSSLDPKSHPQLLETEHINKAHSTNLQETHDHQTKKEKEDRRRLNNRAIYIIGRSLSPTILHEVIHIENAHDMWNHLRRKYDPPPNPFEALKGVRELLHNTDYDRCHGMEDYIRRIERGMEKVRRNLLPGETWPVSLGVVCFLDGFAGSEAWRGFVRAGVFGREGV
ncbi:hypothetical protein VTN00DRAFT_1345 [Thermoascus crustaceus]|uniref:uncharacterized protein n=1 Tax=Thermoascus crustaceus TaxID=5088 RepID=UPI003742210B